MKTWQKWLVVLDVRPDEVSEPIRRKIERATWYEAFDSSTGQTVILLSYVQSGEFTETDPKDCGIDLDSENVTLTRIDDCLKRWNEVDGFYHA